VKPNLECASIAWDSATNAASKNLYAAEKHSSPLLQYHYTNVSEYLCLQAMHWPISWRQFDALFLINVDNGTKFCLSFLETVDTLVPARHVVPKEQNFGLCFLCH
jgi:hypothetical protein